VTDETIDELIEQTSLGTPDAVRHRHSTPPTITTEVLDLLAKTGDTQAEMNKEHTMSTDPNLSPMEWAATLTPAELLTQVRRLATNVHCMDADERRAVLTIVGDELEKK
jgi:hypothetical protein